MRICPNCHAKTRARLIVDLVHCRNELDYQVELSRILIKAANAEFPGVAWSKQTKHPFENVLVEQPLWRVAQQVAVA